MNDGVDIVDGDGLGVRGVAGGGVEMWVPSRYCSSALVDSSSSGVGTGAMTEVEARGDPTYCGDVGEIAASNETSRVIVGLTTGVVLGVGFLACLVSDRT